MCPFYVLSDTPVELFDKLHSANNVRNDFYFSHIYLTQFRHTFVEHFTQIASFLLENINFILLRHVEISNSLSFAWEPPVPFEIVHHFNRLVIV